MRRDMARPALTGVLAICLALAMAPIVIAQGDLEVVIRDVVAEPLPSGAAYTITAHMVVLGQDGRSRVDLAPEDFAVSQDGNPAALESVELVRRNPAVVLVLDASGSMAAEGKMEAVKAAATQFVDGLGEGDQVGVIYFNNQVTVAQAVSDDLRAAISIIDLLAAVPDSGTCLYDAAYQAVNLANTAPPGRRAIILLTDGIDELPNQAGPCSSHTVDEVIELATANTTATPVYTLGVGSRVDQDELARIAADTDGASLIAPASGDIAALFDELLSRLTLQYELIYQSPITSGQHSLAVTVSSGGATSTSVREFVAPALPAALHLSGLDDGALLTDQATVRATFSGQVDVSRVAFALNDELIATDEAEPFEIALEAADLEAGQHSLTATAYLTSGEELTESITFEVQEVVEVAAPTQAVDRAPAPQEEAEPVVGAAGLPAWALPVGGGVLALLAVVIAVSVLTARRRGRQAQIIGGATLPSAYASDKDMTAGIQVSEAWGTLVVQQSLSLAPGQPFDLSGDLIRIGRGADNDVVVPDAPVSRHHAEIRVFGGGEWLVFDLGSSYGTKVNDVAVEEAGHPLRDGDVLRLGTRTAFSFKAVYRAEAGPEDMTIDFLMETVPGGAEGDGSTIPLDLAPEDETVRPMSGPDTQAAVTKAAYPPAEDQMAPVEGMEDSSPPRDDSSDDGFSTVALDDHQ